MRYRNYHLANAECHCRTSNSSIFFRAASTRDPKQRNYTNLKTSQKHRTKPPRGTLFLRPSAELIFNMKQARGATYLATTQILVQNRIGVDNVRGGRQKPETCCGTTCPHATCKFMTYSHTCSPSTTIIKGNTWRARVVFAADVVLDT